MLCWWRVYLVADDGLFDGGEVLKRRKNYVCPLSASDVLGEAAKLFAQSHEDFVFIFDGFCSVGGLDQHGLTWAGEPRDNKPSRKGISSSLVRSGPRARAMVERRWMALRRRRTSSC